MKQEQQFYALVDIWRVRRIFSQSLIFILRLCIVTHPQKLLQDVASVTFGRQSCAPVHPEATFECRGSILRARIAFSILRELVQYYVMRTLKT
jgi:hypothetical protein